MIDWEGGQLAGLMKTLESGTIFDGKYEIEAVLGSGGVGTVYKAQEKELSRTVAIKLLHIWTSSVGEPDSLQRFKREARVLCQLLHPNILRVYRFGLTENDLPFLVMEYVNGESLRNLLDKNGPIEYQKVTQIALKLAAALEHAHANGIVHRDLKPENIIVDLSNPGDPMVKLIDFGLCKPEQKTNSTNQRTLTNTGDLLGTALYMSPEQVLGHPVTERSDLYAFALILFEMIVGRGPFSEGNVAEIMMRRTSEEMPEILSLNSSCGLPKQLDAVIQACGARDQSQRPQSASEVVELLKAVPATAAAAKFRPGSRRLLSSKKNSSLLLVSAVVATLAIVAISFSAMFSTGGGQVSVKLPEEITKNAIAELNEKLRKGDLKGAASLVKASTGSAFEQWPVSQRLELLYGFFVSLRAAGEHKMAQEVLPRYLKTGLGQLFRVKNNEPPEWRGRIQEISDYMLNDRHVGKAAWRGVNVALTSDGQLKRDYKGDLRSNLLLRELELESGLRVWTNPQPTQISDYTKYMCELADFAGKAGYEDLYQRYYNTATDLCRKHGFKRFEVLAAEAACRQALRINDLSEAEKQIEFCRQTLKVLDDLPDVKELKASSRRSFHQLESEVESALSKQAELNGDTVMALKHKEFAQKATAESIKYNDDATSSKPSLKAMVISQFDKNKADKSEEK